MKEFDLGIDDIRWYLSVLLAKKILEFREHEADLVRYVWSGNLEKELYNMEEIYLKDLETDFENGYLDELTVRGFFREAAMEKEKRVRR